MPKMPQNLNKEQLTLLKPVNYPMMGLRLETGYNEYNPPFKERKDYDFLVSYMHILEEDDLHFVALKRMLKKFDSQIVPKKRNILSRTANYLIKDEEWIEEEGLKFYDAKAGEVTSRDTVLAMLDTLNPVIAEGQQQELKLYVKAEEINEFLSLLRNRTHKYRYDSATGKILFDQDGKKIRNRSALRQSWENPVITANPRKVDLVKMLTDIEGFEPVTRLKLGTNPHIEHVSLIVGENVETVEKTLKMWGYPVINEPAVCNITFEYYINKFYFNDYYDNYITTAELAGQTERIEMAKRKKNALIRDTTAFRRVVDEAYRLGRKSEFKQWFTKNLLD